MTNDINKIEIVIERLTEISSDLNKLLAVHEQRLNQHEKQFDSLEEIVEKRREAAELKMRDLYDQLRIEDKNILSEITSLRKENGEYLSKIDKRMTDIENKTWLYIGGVAVIAFLISYGHNILTKLV